MSNSTIAKCEITYKGDQPSELEEMIVNMGGINRVLEYPGEATFEIHETTSKDVEESLIEVKEYLSECEGISSFTISSSIYEFIDEGYYFDSKEEQTSTED
jgi:hypothetical protein